MDGGTVGLAGEAKEVSECFRKAAYCWSDGRAHQAVEVMTGLWDVPQFVYRKLLSTVDASEGQFAL